MTGCNGYRQVVAAERCASVQGNCAQEVRVRVSAQTVCAQEPGTGRKDYPQKGVIVRRNALGIVGNSYTLSTVTRGMGPK